jgi:hypothetical protein
MLGHSSIVTKVEDGRRNGGIAMSKEEKTVRGVNVELGTKAASLDLTRRNTIATLYLTLGQVERLQKILAVGVRRLQVVRSSPKPNKTPKLRLNVKLGTKQWRIFVPGVVWRSRKLKP